MSELRVALTFDAEHPSRAAHRPDGANQILDVLAQSGTRATFFLQGRWASAFPATARRIAQLGHLVGSHSHYHAPMTLLSEAGIVEDLQRAEHRIREITGANPRPWFRYPFGEGAHRPDIQSILTELGYRDTGWSVDPRDWEERATASGVASFVLEACASSSGDPVVLFHTWGGSTPIALQEIIQALRARDVAFVTVSELADGS